MDHGFWKKRWEEKNIGFNQDKINEALVKYSKRITLKPNDKVFVPLCGKTIDMIWLRDQGFKIIGVELSSIACEDFFKEQKISPNIYSMGKFILYEKDDIKIYCGDFFDLTEDMLKDVVFVYDRAALIALPSDLREAYAKHLMEIVPNLAIILLLTSTYDNQRNAPPFCVDNSEVIRLFSQHRQINELETLNASNNTKLLKSNGFINPIDHVFWLEPHQK